MSLFVRLYTVCLLCAAFAHAQVGSSSAFSCIANAGVPPLVRAEGITELVGDIVLNCTGGTPTAPGLSVPQVNIQIFLNTNVTSRLTKDPFSEALLLVDDPPFTNYNLRAGSDISTLIGTESGINYKTPSAPGNGPQNVRNVYQGRQFSPNSVIWLGVPVSPPVTAGGTRILRITNVRANANALGAQRTTLTPSQILSFVSITGDTGPVPIENARQPLGILASGPLDFIAGNAFAQNDCVSQNPDASPQGRPFLTRFRESFPGSFRTRVAESGLSSNLFSGNHPTGGNLSEIGLADHGTRLRAAFNNVPNGVRLFVLNSAGSTSSPGVQAQLVSPTPGSSALTQVTLTGGSGVAIWDVTNANPTSIDTFDFNVFPSYTSTGRFGDIALGTALETGSFGANTGSIPSFFTPANPTNRFAVFTVTNCSPGAPAFNAPSQLPLNFNSTQGGPAPPVITQIADAFNNQITGVEVTPTVDPVPQKDPAVTVQWLTATLNQTNTPATASVSVNPTGLAPRTYTGAVRISSPAGAGFLNYPVRLAVTAPGPSFAINGLGNAASYDSFQVAPGEAIVIFGERFGPPALAGLRLTAAGVAETNIGETRVLFDGEPAPMIYAVNGQISAFAPFSLAGKTSTRVQVEYRGVRSAEVVIPVVASQPGLFTANNSGTGQGAILNQDSSVNSTSNPSDQQQVVVLFGTGAGQTNPPGQNGRVATGTIPALTLPVKVFIDGKQASVLYAGQAPGLIEGVLQVNARLPPDTPSGNVSVAVQIGDQFSQPGVTVAVR